MTLAQAQETAQSGAAQFSSDRMWGLKELPLPEPVGYWPQTPGWYVLALILLLAVALLIWWRWRRWQRDAYRRAAMMQLRTIASDTERLAELPFVLRKTALDSGRRGEVADLRGREWITWLNEIVGRHLFDDEDAELIDRLPYVTPASLRSLRDEQRIERLLEASRTWVREHRAAV